MRRAPGDRCDEAPPIIDALGGNMQRTRTRAGTEDATGALDAADSDQEDR